MAVQEDVALDPGIGAVEVQLIIARAGKDVIQKLDNGAGPIATGEINHVVVADGNAKEVARKNAVAPALDAARSMDQLKLGGRAGEFAVANNERSAVQMDVGGGGVAESEVIEKHRACAHLDARVLRSELEPGVSNLCFRRTDRAIDGEA